MRISTAKINFVKVTFVYNYFLCLVYKDHSSNLQKIKSTMMSFVVAVFFHETHVKKR